MRLVQHISRKHLIGDEQRHRQHQPREVVPQLGADLVNKKKKVLHKYKEFLNNKNYFSRIERLKKTTV
jgi:hypothetical protein